MSTYLRLLRYVKPHLGIFGMAIGCMAVFSLFGGIELSAIFPLADRLLTDGTIPSPAWLPEWLRGVVECFNTVEPLQILTIGAITIPIYFLLKGIL